MNSFGKTAHAGGLASELLAGGWLPRHAAAAALGITVRQLDVRARFGEIRSRAIGPRTRLYEVRR